MFHHQDGSNHINLYGDDMAAKSIAGKWVKENSGLRVDRMAHWEDPKNPRTELAQHLRRVAKSRPTVKDFVESNRSTVSQDCIFVPGAKAGSPSRVRFCGRNISAARYMALLTFGAPRTEGAVVRHLCGNGHLSCVNPAHLAWGSEARNIADAVKHRGCETAQEKIDVLFGRL